VRKQSLTMDIPAGNFTINADKAKIEQLLVNLIDNAIKYTPAEGTITISLVNQHPSLAINIQDSGIGIPAEHLGRIFERFYRVDKARSRQFGGTGLGLAIVKHIVSLHQGTIQIESKLTLGTLIKITLPIN